MRLRVISFGKLKTPGLRDAADYYLKLLSSCTQATELELKPLAVPDKSEATRKRIQTEEGTVLLEALEKGGGRPPVLYLLDEIGRAQPTREWAKLVTQWEGSGEAEIALAVGSSLGFSPEVRKRARGSLSLGPQTLPHELARVVLLEQLYRAWSVNQNHPYHNEGS